MSSWLQLEGRRVVVAGAGGIGGRLVEGFVEAGSRVLVADADPSRLDAVGGRSDLRAHGGDTLRADLRDPSQCRSVIARAEEVFGGLDVLVHAVGINPRLPVEELTDEQWEEILSVNLSSAFWLGQAAGRAMRAQRHGRIVFLSSVSGQLAHREHAPYAASKGGLNQMMRVMAAEWAADGVTVNAVAPGYTETDLTREYLESPGRREALTSQVPAGRLGSVDDLVGPVLFLASEQARFVTGHVLYVDGGRTLV